MSATPSFDLTGRVAVVTGGAGLLGTRFCHGLAAHGASVAVVDRDGDAAEAVSQRVAAEHGVASTGVGCDVTDPAAVAAMVETVADRLGPVRILHNNAAAKTADKDAFFAPFERYALDTWRAVMAVNIDGMFLVAQAVGRHMLAHELGGSIVQTASIYGAVAPDQRIYDGSEYEGRAINTPAVYSASKAAVLGLTRHLAAYWAPDGIRVNSLTPGGVASGQNDEFRRRYSARVPLGRMGEADEMVGALVFLASDASSYVTGHNLVVDGGLTAW